MRFFLIQFVLSFIISGLLFAIIWKCVKRADFECASKKISIGLNEMSIKKQYDTDFRATQVDLIEISIGTFQLVNEFSIV